MPTIYQIITIALFVAFIILVLNKNGYREIARNFCDKINLSLIAKMLDCDLCFSFWLSLFICLLLTFILRDVSFLLIPIFSTPITRIIL